MCVLLQLHDAQEELKVREARWGSTLARYRVKIESLEAENKELQSDLRMMEEERLQVWQMQVRSVVPLVLQLESECWNWQTLCFVFVGRNTVSVERRN